MDDDDSVPPIYTTAPREPSVAWFYCLIWAIGAGYFAWWFWPSGIADLRFAEMTFGTLGRIGVCVLAGVVALGLVATAIKNFE